MRVVHKRVIALSVSSLIWAEISPTGHVVVCCGSSRPISFLFFSSLSTTTTVAEDSGTIYFVETLILHFFTETYSRRSFRHQRYVACRASHSEPVHELHVAPRQRKTGQDFSYQKSKTLAMPLSCIQSNRMNHYKRCVYSTLA